MLKMTEIQSLIFGLVYRLVIEGFYERRGSTLPSEAVIPNVKGG
jgi:hypothetical protein